MTSLEQAVKTIRNPEVGGAKICLEDSDIGDEGAKAIAEALKDAKVGHKIDLGLNHIGAKGAKAIAEALKDAKVGHEIDLNSNNIEAKGAKAIAEALKDTKVGHVISLRYNKIGAEGSRTIAEALKDAKVGHSVDIGGNDIRDEGAKIIAEALKDAKVGHVISLRYNKIGAEGAKIIAEALKDAKVWHSVDIGGNHIGNEGAKALAGILSTTSSPLDILGLDGWDVMKDAKADNFIVEAASNPAAFLDKINEKFSLKKGYELITLVLPRQYLGKELPMELINLISSFLGENETVRLNAQAVVQISEHNKYSSIPIGVVQHDFAGRKIGFFYQSPDKKGDIITLFKKDIVETSNIPTSAIAALSAQDVLEAGPTLKYFVREILHLDVNVLELSNAAWMGIHLALGAIGALMLRPDVSIVYNIEAASISTATYFAKTQLYENMQQYAQSRESLLVMVAGQIVMSLINGGVTKLLIPSLGAQAMMFDMLISASIGALQHYQTHHQDETHQKSSIEMAVLYLVDTMAGYLAYKSTWLPGNNAVSKMLFVKQLLAGISSVVTADYLAKIAMRVVSDYACDCFSDNGELSHTDNATDDLNMGAEL
jgi:Ran GTPase-activating protein (RanGAP) involved in mRNA processing and transport